MYVNFIGTNALWEIHNIFLFLSSSIEDTLHESQDEVYYDIANT